jgi:hypothetical protein
LVVKPLTSPSALAISLPLYSLASQRHIPLWLSSCRMFRAETQPPQSGSQENRNSLGRRSRQWNPTFFISLSTETN